LQLTDEEILRDINRRHINDRRTICQVHREIFKQTDSDEIKRLIIEAYRMAKKMAARLNWYKTGGTK